LKGTIDGGASFGFIIVEERGKNKQRLYRLGDMIGSAKLLRVTRNTAIIKSGDREITLKIKQTAESSLFPRSQTQQENKPSFGKAPHGWGRAQTPRVNIPDFGKYLDKGAVPKPETPQAPQQPRTIMPDPNVPTDPQAGTE